MKKFKGGLYADLSNYNTTLPNTNVLLNFFKSNPIGYRSGGMVRGIAGGNPTGMRVTGGFLANAQKFAQGSSADYPFDLLGKDYYTPSDPYVDPLNKTQISSYYKKPERLEKLLREKKIDIKPPQKTFTTNDVRVIEGFTEKSEPIPIWSNYARKFDTNKERWVHYSEKEKKAAKKKYVDSLTSQYTSIMGGDYKGPSVYEDLPEDIAKEMREGKTTAVEDEDKTEFQRKLEEHKDVGQTGQKFVHRVPKEEISSIEEAEKLLKDDETKIETKSNETSIAKNINESSTSKSQELIDTMTGKTKEDIKNAIAGIKSVSFPDEKAINDIGKELYGEGKGKDAPAWALPLMIAGFTMAASDNPDMLGAAGEGGIKGIEEYARIQKEKKQDIKDKIDLELKKYDFKVQKSKYESDKAFQVASLETDILKINDQRDLELIRYQQSDEQFWSNYHQDDKQWESEMALKIQTFDWDKKSKYIKHFQNEKYIKAQVNTLNSQAKSYNKPDGELKKVEIDGETKYVWYGWDPSTNNFILKNLETADGLHLGPSETDKILSTFVKEMIPYLQADPDMDIQELYDKFSELQTDVGTLKKPTTTN